MDKAAKKPKLPLTNFGGQAYAFPDLFHSLKAGECHLIVDSDVYDGAIVDDKT